MRERRYRNMPLATFEREDVQLRVLLIAFDTDQPHDLAAFCASQDRLISVLAADLHEMPH